MAIATNLGFPRIGAHRKLKKALEVLDPTQIWVNPDCGLKTRNWEEVSPSLKHMVQAAQQLREEIYENIR